MQLVESCSSPLPSAVDSVCLAGLVDLDVCVDASLAGLAAPQDSLDRFPVLLLCLAYGGQLFGAHLLELCLVEEAQLAHLVL